MPTSCALIRQGLTEVNFIRKNMSNSLKNEQGLSEIGLGHRTEDEESLSSPMSSKNLVTNSNEWPDEYKFDENELRREEPLQNTYDKHRNLEDDTWSIRPSTATGQRGRAKSSSRLSMSNNQQQNQPFMSNSHHLDEDDVPASMEEKSIVQQDNLIQRITEDKPHNPDHALKSLDKKKDPSKDQSEDDDEEDDDDQDSHQIPAEGLYDPNEFANLPVNSEIKELFQFISAYTPQVIELDTMLKPFILDYIPAVGDIDAFIKIPRPDDVEDNLGLIVLDEPCAKQSDPTVLDLHLRAASKDAVPKGTVVKRLARAERNPKEIENWIKSIGELHKSKPATQVHYSKPMPDIDTLMQEWPPEVEETLKQIDLPSADLDPMPLEQYVDAACALLDIPVYKSRIQSLHVLFTLYSEFKNSQHFRALAEENRAENASSAQKASGNTDRLVL